MSGVELHSNLHWHHVCSAVGELEYVEYSFDVSNMVDCNGQPLSLSCYCHSEVLNAVGNMNPTAPLEPIIQEYRDRDHACCGTDDDNIVIGYLQ